VSVKLVWLDRLAMVVLRTAPGWPMRNVQRTKLTVAASTVTLAITTQYCDPAA
jgi:hypothetical protein